MSLKGFIFYTPGNITFILNKTRRVFIILPSSEEHISLQLDQNGLQVTCHQELIFNWTRKVFCSQAPSKKNTDE